MVHPPAVRLLLLGGVLLLCGCGAASKDLTLNVAWTFQAGDCASNAISRVRVTWGPAGGGTTDVEFDCSAGQGTLGQFDATGGTYGLTAVGLDAAGVARFTHFGSSVTVSENGNGGHPIELTLRPKPADVIVTWQMRTGGGCPTGFVLPYTVTLYRPPPTAGGTRTTVQSTQESCSRGTATLSNVTPGDYVVEVDSRAISPMVKGEKPVTVRGGENATVDFQF